MYYTPPTKQTASLHLKNDALENDPVSLGMVKFLGRHVKLREGEHLINDTVDALDGSKLR